MIRVSVDDVLYQMARIVSYPTWIAAFIIGILLAAGVLDGRGWLVAALVLLGIAMPIGVKLSRMELTKTMVTVFHTGVIMQRERDVEMSMSQQQRRSTRKTNQANLLREDVASMLRDRGEDSADSLAQDVIVVVRERVLAELSSYARENIR